MQNCTAAAAAMANLHGHSSALNLSHTNTFTCPSLSLLALLISIVHASSFIQFRVYFPVTFLPTKIPFTQFCFLNSLFMRLISPKIEQQQPEEKRTENQPIVLMISRLHFC